jgi:hypothetical protein
MANHYKENVIFVDTDNADYTNGPLYIKNVTYKGNTSGQIIIRDGGSSGSILWQGDGASDINEQLHLRASNGIWVDVANGASVFIYLR